MYYSCISTVEDDIRSTAGGEKVDFFKVLNTHNSKPNFFPRKYKMLENQLLIKETFICMSVLDLTIEALILWSKRAVLLLG